MRRTALQRKTPLRAKKRATAKLGGFKRTLTVTDILRSYGFPESKVKQGKHGLRYRTPLERGILWYYFSLFIRKRDLERYGTCISCGKRIEDGHAGHFISTNDCSFDEMVFNELNVNLECPNCNQHDKGKLDYAKNLDARYGEGTAESLRTRYYDSRKTQNKNWTKLELLSRIIHYQSLIERPFQFNPS